MDNRLRPNEICCKGKPRCGYAFSSARTCFIAYGFEESSLEKDVLCSLLKDCDIQPVEAGGELAPAQDAFCAKICSKIITSQFCIVVLNNDSRNGIEVPNANVNMEYGLMLGFNKYVIPFQRESQTLPFNVAALDTVKYKEQSFKSSAQEAIAQAIKETARPFTEEPGLLDQNLAAFLLSQDMLITSIESPGNRNIFEMGQACGFLTLHDFSGMNYAYLGKFTSLHNEVILWRVKKLAGILGARRASLEEKCAAGLCTLDEKQIATRFFDTVEIWLLVTTDSDKTLLQREMQRICPRIHETRVFSLDEVKSALESLELGS